MNRERPRIVLDDDHFEVGTRAMWAIERLDHRRSIASRRASEPHRGQPAPGELLDGEQNFVALEVGLIARDALASQIHPLMVR